MAPHFLSSRQTDLRCLRSSTKLRARRVHTHPVVGATLLARVPVRSVGVTSWLLAYGTETLLTGCSLQIGNMLAISAIGIDDIKVQLPT